MSKTATETYDELLNAIFPSKEDKTVVEHIDMDFSDFIRAIKRLYRDAKKYEDLINERKQ